MTSESIVIKTKINNLCSNRSSKQTDLNLIDLHLFAICINNTPKQPSKIYYNY